MNDHRRHTYPPPPDVEPVDPAPDLTLSLLSHALVGVCGVFCGVALGLLIGARIHDCF